jgi:hypothetical protein
VSTVVRSDALRLKTRDTNEVHRKTHSHLIAKTGAERMQIRIGHLRIILLGLEYWAIKNEGEDELAV